MVQCELRDQVSAIAAFLLAPPQNNAFHIGDCLKPKWMTDPESKHDQNLNRCYNTHTYSNMAATKQSLMK